MLTGHVMHEAAFLFLAHLYKTNFCFLFFVFCLSIFLFVFRCVALSWVFVFSFPFIFLYLVAFVTLVTAVKGLPHCYVVLLLSMPMSAA